MPPTVAAAAPPPPPRKGLVQTEIFPQGQADFGVAPDGWKPYRNSPQLKTRSGMRILSDVEFDAYMRRNWLGVQETAAVLSVSDQQVYNLIADGSLKATHIGRDPQAAERKHYRILTAEVRAFLAARSTDTLGT